MNLAASSSNPALINIALDAFVTAAEADPLGTAFIVKNREAIEKLARKITSSSPIRTASIKQVIPSTDYTIQSKSPMRNSSVKRNSTNNLSALPKTAVRQSLPSAALEDLAIYGPSKELKEKVLLMYKAGEVKEKIRSLVELIRSLEDNADNIQRAKKFIIQLKHLKVPAPDAVERQEQELEEYIAKSITLKAEVQTLLQIPTGVSVPLSAKKVAAALLTLAASPIIVTQVANDPKASATLSKAISSSVILKTATKIPQAPPIGPLKDLKKKLSPKDVSNIVAALNDPAVLTAVKTNTDAATALIAVVGNNPELLISVSKNKTALKTVVAALEDKKILQTAKEIPEVADALLTLAASPIIVTQVANDPQALQTLGAAINSPKLIASAKNITIPLAPPQAPPAAAFLGQIGNFKFNSKKPAAKLSQIREKNLKDLNKLPIKPAAKPAAKPVVCAKDDMICFAAQRYAAIHGDDNSDFN
jgi:hypothetical protein